MKAKIKVFTNMNQFMKYFLPNTLKEDEKILEKIKKQQAIWIEKENK